MSRLLSQPFPRPLDPITKRDAKLYFKVIQITHHHTIISRAIDTGFFPSGMRPHAIKLTQFIRPAIPNSQTKKLLDLNTTEWMHQNLEILHQHYSTQLSVLLQSTTTPFNSTAFQIASGWAKKRFNTRLSSTTLTTAQQSLLTSCLSLQSPSTPTPPQKSSDNFQSTPCISDPNEFPPLQPPLHSFTSSKIQATQLSPKIHDHGEPSNDFPAPVSSPTSLSVPSIPF